MIGHGSVDPFALGEHIPTKANPPVAVGLTPGNCVSFPAPTTSTRRQRCNNWRINTNNHWHNYLRRRSKFRQYHLPIIRGTLPDLANFLLNPFEASGRKILLEWMNAVMLSRLKFFGILLPFFICINRSSTFSNPFWSSRPIKFKENLVDSFWNSSRSFRSFECMNHNQGF